MPRSRMCPAKLLGSMFLVCWTLAVSYVALGSTQNAASLKAAALDIDRPAPCKQDLARTWNAKKKCRTRAEAPSRRTDRSLPHPRHALCRSQCLCLRMSCACSTQVLLNFPLAVWGLTGMMPSCPALALVLVNSV